MPAWRSTLDRFLPAGTAGVAGVPADRAADANAELTPVLAALAGTQTQAATIRQDAVVRAQARRQEASRQAVVLVAEATARAESARLATAAQITDTARAAAEAGSATAATRIRRTKEQADQRLPRYVDRVVGEAEALLRATISGQE